MANSVRLGLVRAQLAKLELGSGLKKSGSFFFYSELAVSAILFCLCLQREEVPVVRRPDRKELLAFLKGTDSLIPKSIDKSARLEMPTHVKRSAEDKLEGTAAKKARLDGGQVMKKLFFLISCFKISQDTDQND